MTKEEKEKLEESITYAEDKLQRGLVRGEAASQLSRMVYYYREKIKNEYVEE